MLPAAQGAGPAPALHIRRVSADITHAPLARSHVSAATNEPCLS
jgi:hypothetical protein